MRIDKIIAYTVVACLFAACSPPMQGFKKEHQFVTKKFFENIPQYKFKGETITVDSVKCYVAELKEVLIEKDKVPEYDLININSDRLPDVYIGEKGHAYLYLFELLPAVNGNTFWVYLGTKYNKSNDSATPAYCTGLGPAYLGVMRMEQLNINYTFKLKKDKNSKLDKDEWQYVLDDPKKVDQIWVMYDDQPDVDDKASLIRVKQIIKMHDNNEVSADRALFFTTKKVFNDSAALHFKYWKTIKE